MRYRFCNQTVTVYHRAEADVIERTVYDNAFLDRQKVLNVNKTGSAESNGFLLVIPGNPPLAVGDKVLEGEGPECPDDAAWRVLIPTKVAGLVVVRQVDPKRDGRGNVCHVEAGG